MGLIDRLISTFPEGGDEKIPVHTFYAALGELKDGEVTKAQVVSYFNLDTAAEAELDALIAKYQSVAIAEREHFMEVVHRILLLARAEVPGYTTKAEINARLSSF